jgi:sodium-coupled neutral amino acid transporter 7/8
MKYQRFSTPSESEVNQNLTKSVSGLDLSSLSETNADGSGWLGTSLILANIILGVGLLNLPAAYSSAGGLPTALAAQTLCVVCIVVSLYLIVECADIGGSETYQDTVKTYCGTPALVLCRLLIFLHNFGTCVVFMVILADQLEQVMLYAYGPGYCRLWYLSRPFTLSVTSIIMLPLSLYARIDSFKIISALGILSTLYITALVIFKFITYHEEESSVIIEWVPGVWTTIFQIFPVICYSFEGHVESVPLYACMKKRQPMEFLKVAVFALTICGVIYSLVGCLVYLTVGKGVPSDLLQAYPVDIPVIIGTAIMGLKAIVTYPAIMFCSRMVLHDSIQGFCTSELNDTTSRILESVVLYIIALGLAQLVPTIGSVISLLGGSAALFVFVFPGLCTLQAHLHGARRGSRVRVAVGVGMVSLGVFLAVSTTVQAVMDVASNGLSANTGHC